jgi:hypothetical protein
MAVHAPQAVADLPPEYETLYEGRGTGGPLRLGIEYARFGWRRMSREAAPILRELTRAGDAVYIVTGRSAAGLRIVQSWLSREQLSEQVQVRMAPPGLRPPQHKLAVARMLDLDVHIDDDPRTAYHLARNGVPRVFLLQHTSVEFNDPAPPGLVAVQSLGEFMQRLRAERG